MLETQKISENEQQEPQPVRQLSNGFILGDRYEIQEVIGVGGMGSVYRARDLHFPNAIKLVAVKEMINQAPDPLVRKTIVQNFEREANILVSLSHPSIPKIFDYFTFDERSYLVLEYVHGKDLEALLHDVQAPLQEDQVIKWAIELCDVIDYLHNHKPEAIIFRDMKPSNVMVNQQNHIMLVDFGIAKIFRVGQKGTMIGTEGYSPPEQYRGEASPLADIYALGATMHHLLTNRDPRLEAPFTFAERPIRQINPLISAEIENVINTAIQYNPPDRFQSISALKEALLVAAKKTGALTRIGGSTSSLATESSIKPLWMFRCEDEIRCSPICEGGMVFVGAYDNNLYALDATDGKFLWKFPTEGGIVNRPIVSDNVVYTGSEDKNLYAISSRSGKLLWNFATEGPIRCSPRIAEGHIFFGSDDGFFYAVNILSNRKTWAIDAGSPIRSTPFLTQDYLYFGCESGDFYCLDYRSTTHWRFKAKRAITSSPIVSQGTVCFASVDSTVYALDAKSGWVIWRFRMSKGSVSSPSRVNDLILIGSADENIYCIDATSAKEIWRFKTNHQVSGSPIINKDAVYCGSADGWLYCLDLKTGYLRWKFETGGPITSTPTIHNDVLFIGSSDHILYALMI